MVDAVSGDTIDGVEHVVGGESYGHVEHLLSVDVVGHCAERSGGDREHQVLGCSGDGHRLRLVGGDGGGRLVSAGDVGCGRVQGHVALTHGQVVLSGYCGDHSLSVLHLGGELGHVVLVGGHDDRSVLDGVSVDVVDGGGDRLRGGGHLESDVGSGRDGHGTGSHGASSLGVECVRVRSGEDGSDLDLSVEDLDVDIARIALELEEHVLCAVDLVSDRDGSVDGCRGDLVGLGEVAVGVALWCSSGGRRPRG